MSLVNAIRDMLARGMPVEQALLAAEVIEASLTGPKSNAQRQAEWRAREKAKRNESNDAVTDRNENNENVTFVTAPHNTETAPTHAEPEPNKTTSSPVQKDILTDIPKVPAAKPDDGFAALWDAYPQRQGGNSRKNAEASYRKARKAGVPARTILDGVQAYAEHCDATGKTRTEFVKTAEAWLNGRYWESDWSISLSRPGPPPRQTQNRRSLVDALHRMIPDEPSSQPEYPRLAFGR